MTTDFIQDVSGTAFWIAHHRAVEAERDDALFVDPWAAELAGERGRRIVQQLRGMERFAWSIVTRVKVIDQWVVEAVTRDGVDTVVNLGAGLDTRAFRLPLPSTLRWFDVDSAEIAAHKHSVLRDAQPRCAWRAVTADLSIDAVRQRTLRDLAADARKILVISEGLLMYLTPAAVRSLATELHELPAYHTWLFDLLTEEGVRSMKKQWRQALAQVNAEFQFAPAEGLACFEPLGWQEAQWASLATTAFEYGRMPTPYRFLYGLLRWMPRERRERLLRASGVARLQRASTLQSAEEAGQAP
jgi:methyltransferase (TIGR00027 family)